MSSTARRHKRRPARERERMAIEELPRLLAAARRIHASEPEAKAAALFAASGLAGIVGWTPEMVAAIEEGRCQG